VGLKIDDLEFSGKANLKIDIQIDCTAMFRYKLRMTGQVQSW